MGRSVAKCTSWTFLALLSSSLFGSAGAFAPCHPVDVGASHYCRWPTTTTGALLYRQHHPLRANGGDGIDSLAAAWMSMNQDASDSDPSPPLQPLGSSDSAPAPPVVVSSSSSPPPMAPPPPPPRVPPPPPPVPPSTTTTATAKSATTTPPPPTKAATEIPKAIPTSTPTSGNAPRRMARHNLVRNAADPLKRTTTTTVNGALRQLDATPSPAKLSASTATTTTDADNASQISTRWHSVPAKRSISFKSGPNRTPATDIGVRRMPLNEIRAPHVPPRTIERRSISSDSVKSLPPQIATRWESVPKLKSRASVSAQPRQFAADTYTRKISINEIQQITTRWDSVPRKSSFMPNKRTSATDTGTRRMSINEICRTPAIQPGTSSGGRRKAISSNSVKAEAVVFGKPSAAMPRLSAAQEQQAPPPPPHVPPSPPPPQDFSPTQPVEEEVDTPPQAVVEEPELAAPQSASPPPPPAPSTTTMEQLAREWGAVNQDHDV
ncbi:hypothetical protein ACA910_004019 [Epithemia clementina (nom. ined.)]